MIAGSGSVITDVIRLEQHKMKFSLRALMALVLVAAVAIVGWQFYLKLPPSGHGTWSNRVTQYGDDYSTPTSRIDFGGFESNGEHFAGFMVRIDDPESRSYPPWLKFDDGCLYVDGNRVLPSKAFQLFVADNGNSPKRILLEPKEALEFRQRPAIYDKWNNYWSSINPDQ